MTVVDKETFAYWDSAKLEDIVQLKDEQTIAFLMEEGHEYLSHGADFTLKRKRKIEAHDGKTKWLILDIEYSPFTWYLIIKSNGSDFDLYLYYVPDGFVDGDRKDVVENSDWLFEEFAEGTPLKDVPFALDVKQGEDVIFKTDGPQYGTLSEDGDKSFATIVEYDCDIEEEENPLLMAMELNEMQDWETSEKSFAEDEEGDIEVEVSVEGGVNINEDSSYITLLQGCRLLCGDVEILRV